MILDDTTILTNIKMIHVGTIKRYLYTNFANRIVHKILKKGKLNVSEVLNGKRTFLIVDPSSSLL